MNGKADRPTPGSARVPLMAHALSGQGHHSEPGDSSPMAPHISAILPEFDAGGLDVSLLSRETHGMATGSNLPPGALTYSRAVYASIMDWYKVADSKSQLLLTLNGIYITVLSSLAISSYGLVNHVGNLPLIAWFLLAAAAAATAISTLSTIACLYSRLSNAKLDQLRDLFTDRDEQGSIHYRPAVMYWFGTIARVDRDTGLGMLRSADEAFELSALTEEILLLSRNVLAKHRWANRGWAAAGASLLLLLAAAVSAVVAAR